MLVRRCVIQNCGTVVLHHPMQSIEAGYAADLRVESNVRVLVAHLPIDVKQGSLRLIETDNGQRFKLRYLAANLRPDRPRRARYHYDSSLNALPNQIQIELHRCPAS